MMSLLYASPPKRVNQRGFAANVPFRVTPGAAGQDGAAVSCEGSGLTLAYNLYMPSGGLNPLEGINSQAVCPNTSEGSWKTKSRFWNAS